MTIKIDLLKNCPEHIPRLIEIWHEGIAKRWTPEACIERVKEKLNHHLNVDRLPLTFVAIENDTPIGMCSLRENDGIRPELTPWLGSLVVDPHYQKQGIGKILIDFTKEKAKQLGFNSLYLLTFDPNLSVYYTKLGWQKIGMDSFEGHAVTVMITDMKN